MSSHVSISVYPEEELQKLIHYVKQLKFVGGDNGHYACVVGECRGLGHLRSSENILRSHNEVPQ